MSDTTDAVLCSEKIRGRRNSRRNAIEILVTVLIIIRAGTCNGGTGVVTALTKAPAPRADAFGGAAAGLGGDPALVWVNPASGMSEETMVTFAGRRGYLQDLTGQVLTAWPAWNGVVSVGALYYDAGSSRMTTGDDLELSTTIQRDYLGMVSYCRDIMPGVTQGATLKGFYTDLSGMAGSSALALDAGVQVRLPERITAGLLIQNLGARLNYFEDSIVLPASMRIGLCWPWDLGRVEGESVRLLVLCDGEYVLVQRLAALRGGVEYSWRGLVALRAGIHLREGRKTVCSGFGVNYAGSRLDYCVQFSGAGDVTTGVSVSIPLGKNAAIPVPEPRLTVMTSSPTGITKAMRASMAFAPRGLDLKVPIKEWKAVVTDRYDRVVKTIAGVGTPPKELEWDGLDDRGRPVVDLSTARISLNMKDAVGKPIEANWTIPVASAEPQLLTIASPLADSEVKFGMPRRNFQCWQLQVKDGPVDVAS